MNTSIFSIQRAYYDQVYRGRSDASSLDRLCQLHAIRRCLGMIYLPPEAKILELGCGTGALAGELSRWGAVTGVDLSPEAVRLAQAAHPQVRFHAANFLDDPALGNGYHLIVAQEVLAHVQTPDQPRMIQLLYEKLAPGGSVILTTPNRDVVERFTLAPESVPPVQHWLNRGELASLLHPCFRVVALTTACFFQPFFRRHPVLNWWRYLWYCRLHGLAMTENLLARSPSGAYLCCLAQR